MSKDVDFYLDTGAASEILTKMVAPVIKQSGEAIATRARSIASSMSSDPPEISIQHTVAVKKKGARAVAIITVKADDAHELYIGTQALSKAKDAGRV